MLNTSFSEVFKLPKLVSHFLEHHNLDHEVGVIQFISMHYLGHDINDNDEEDDMKLPFKKITAQGHISHAIHPAKTTFLKQHYTFILTAVCIPQHDTPSNPALGALFRPPRA